MRGSAPVAAPAARGASLASQPRAVPNAHVPRRAAALTGGVPELQTLRGGSQVGGVVCTCASTPRNSGDVTPAHRAPPPLRCLPPRADTQRPLAQPNMPVGHESEDGTHSSGVGGNGKQVFAHMDTPQAQPAGEAASPRAVVRAGVTSSTTALLRVLCLVACLDAAAEVAVSRAALPFLAARLGAPHPAWVIRAVAPVIALLAAPLWGTAADAARVRWHALLQLTLATSAVATLLCGLAPSLPALAAARALHGLAGGGALWAAVAMAVSSGARPAAAVTCLFAAAGLGAVASGMGIYAFRNSLGLVATTSLAAGLLLMAVLAVATAASPAAAAPQAPSQNGDAAPAPSSLALFAQLALRCVWGIAFGACIALLPRAFAASTGASTHTTALLFAAMGASAAMAQLAAFAVVRKRSRVAASLVQLLAAAAAAVAAHTWPGALAGVEPTRAALWTATGGALGLALSGSAFQSASITRVLALTPPARIGLVCGLAAALDGLLREAVVPHVTAGVLATRLSLADTALSGFGTHALGLVTVASLLVALPWRTVGRVLASAGGTLPLLLGLLAAMPLALLTPPLALRLTATLIAAAHNLPVVPLLGAAACVAAVAVLAAWAARVSSGDDLPAGPASLLPPPEVASVRTAQLQVGGQVLWAAAQLKARRERATADAVAPAQQGDVEHVTAAAPTPPAVPVRVAEDDQLAARRWKGVVASWVRTKQAEAQALRAAAAREEQARLLAARSAELAVQEQQRAARLASLKWAADARALQEQWQRAAQEAVAREERARQRWFTVVTAWVAQARVAKEKAARAEAALAAAQQRQLRAAEAQWGADARAAVEAMARQREAAQRAVVAEAAERERIVRAAQQSWAQSARAVLDELTRQKQAQQRAADDAAAALRASERRWADSARAEAEAMARTRAAAQRAAQQAELAEARAAQAATQRWAAHARQLLQRMQAEQAAAEAATRAAAEAEARQRQRWTDTVVPSWITQRRKAQERAQREAEQQAAVALAAAQRLAAEEAARKAAEAKAEADRLAAEEAAALKAAQAKAAAEARAAAELKAAEEKAEAEARAAAARVAAAEAKAAADKKAAEEAAARKAAAEAKAIAEKQAAEEAAAQAKQQEVQQRLRATESRWADDARIQAVALAQQRRLAEDKERRDAVEAAAPPQEPPAPSVVVGAASPEPTSEKATPAAPVAATGKQPGGQAPKPVMWLLGAAAAVMLLASLGRDSTEPADEAPQKQAPAPPAPVRVAAPARKQLIIRRTGAPAAPVPEAPMGVTAQARARRLAQRKDDVVRRARDAALAKRRAELEAARQLAEVANMRRGEQLRAAAATAPPPAPSPAPIAPPAARSVGAAPLPAGPAPVTVTLPPPAPAAPAASTAQVQPVASSVLPVPVPLAATGAAGVGVLGLLARLIGAGSKAAKEEPEKAPQTKPSPPPPVEPRRAREAPTAAPPPASAPRRERRAAAPEPAPSKGQGLLGAGVSLFGATTALIAATTPSQPQLMQRGPAAVASAPEVVAAVSATKKAQLAADNAVVILIKKAGQSREARDAAMRAQRELEEARAATRVAVARSDAMRRGSAAQTVQVAAPRPAPAAPPVKGASRSAAPPSAGVPDELALNLGAGVLGAAVLGAATRGGAERD